LIYDDLAGKMLGFLKAAAPAVSRVAVLWNPDHADPEFRETQRVADGHNVKLQPLPVRMQGDFDKAFQSAIDARAEGLIIVSTRLLLTQRNKIIEFVEKNRIPAVGSWGDWAKDGLLLTYGPNVDQAMARIAVYIDKVLKGVRPSDLPIERPTRFELVVNAKTATLLDIVLPDTLLASADLVIE
jgi:putative ABC transport system substrate-binding protein